MQGGTDPVPKLAALHPSLAAPRLFFAAGVEELSFRAMVIPFVAGLTVTALTFIDILPVTPNLVFLIASFGSAYFFARIHRYGSVWTRVVGALIYTAQFAITGSLLFPTITHFFHNFFIYLHVRYNPNFQYKNP